MALFKRARTETRDNPRLTINGDSQPDPEAIGQGIPRRYRLYLECVRRLAEDPLVSTPGKAVGDGRGLEQLVARIEPLFSQEPSLARWVALRGALTDLHVWVFDPQSAAASQDDLEHVMGLARRTDNDGLHLDLAEPWRSQFTQAEHDAAFGIASSIMIRVEAYPRLEGMTVAEVNADPEMRRVGRALALDMIAWSATAMLRLGIAQQLMSQVPHHNPISWQIQVGTSSRCSGSRNATGMGLIGRPHVACRCLMVLERPKSRSIESCLPWIH